MRRLGRRGVRVIVWAPDSRVVEKTDCLIDSVRWDQDPDIRATTPIAPSSVSSELARAKVTASDAAGALVAAAWTIMAQGRWKDEEE